MSTATSGVGGEFPDFWSSLSGLIEAVTMNPKNGMRINSDNKICGSCAIEVLALFRSWERLNKMRKPRSCTLGRCLHGELFGSWELSYIRQTTPHEPRYQLTSR